MNRQGRPNPSEGLTRKTSFAILTQVTTAALTAAVTLYLVRALAPVDFGNFSLALSIVGLLVIPANLGIAEAAGRLMAESIGNETRLAHIFRRSLVQKLVIAGGLSLMLFGLAAPIARLFDSPGLTGPLRGMSLALFGQAMFNLPDRIFIGLGRIQSRFLNVLEESATEAVCTVGLVVAGLGATGAALGRGIGYTVGAALGILIVARALGGRRALSLSRAETERAPLLQFAVPLFVFAVVYGAFVQVDAIIIGLLKDSEAVGLFQAPVRIVTFLGFLGLAVASAVAPRFALATGREDGGVLLTQTIRILIVSHVAITPFMVVWAAPLVELALGSGYQGSEPVLRALAPFVVMLGVGPLITTTVHYGGDLAIIRRRVPIAVVAIMINVAVDLALVPPLGIIGAAIGTSVAFFIYLLPHFVLAGGIVPAFDPRPATDSLLRSLIAAVGTGAVLLAFGTGSVPLWLLIAGFPIGLSVYVALLLALRVISVGDVSRGYAWLAGKLRG